MIKTIDNSLNRGDKAEIVGWASADITGRIALSSPYTLSNTGWITFYGKANNNSKYLKINNIEVVRTGGSSGEYDDSVHFQMILPAGTKLTFSGSCYYYPFIKN